MLREEVGVMTDLLEQAGFEVVVATRSGETIEGGAVSRPTTATVSQSVNRCPLFP